MADAGLSGGLDFTLSFRSVGNYPDIAAILLDQWKEISMNVELRQYESAAGWAAYQAYDFTAAVQGTGLNFLDPDAANDLLYLPTAGRMYQGWNNDEFNELFEMEKGEVDRAVARPDTSRGCPTFWWRKCTTCPPPVDSGTTCNGNA